VRERERGGSSERERERRVKRGGSSGRERRVKWEREREDK
jgi:hypothetical protein